MEYSKKLITFACVIYAVALAATIISWFVFREVSPEIMRYGTLLFSSGILAYCGKAAYENRAKIETGKAGDKS